MNFDNKSSISRYLFIIIPMTLAGVLILGKSAYLMAAKRDYWETVRKRLASQQKEVPAIRGNIYSADGQLMVGSMPIYTLRMDFKVVDRNDSIAQLKGQAWRDSVFMEKLDSLCDGLHSVFPERPASEFKSLLLSGYKKRKRNLTIKKGASYIEYKQCQQLPYLCYGRIKTGFYAEEIPQRQRPYGSMANRTLGALMTTNDSARNGLELAYDSILRGTNGKMHLEKVRNQRVPKTDLEPVDGLDIVTTIDVGMQDAAEKAIVKKLKEINGEVGVVVLMECATGDVKAIVNMTRIAPGVYAEVKNNAITDLWEPGSTFKTASIMVALEDKVISRNDWVGVGNGQYMMHGRVMKDHNWRKGGYGRAISVPEVLMFSSNVGVSRLIDEHYHNNPEKFVDGLYREGVGVGYSLPFTGHATPRVRRPKPDGSNWSKTALPWMSIGYETQIPPIYTLGFYNAIANNGRMVKPRFVREIRKDGQTVYEFPVEVVKEKICSPSTLKDIRDILEMVVNHPTGLGKKAGCKQFKVSGKTGTAQVADEHGSYHGGVARYMVSFCGFYPSEAPKYSCIVCIKKTGLPASGGGQAGPVFSELAQYVMSKGVFRQADEAADSTSLFVPDVLGGDLATATNLLNQLNIPYTQDLRRDSAEEYGSADINGHQVSLHRAGVTTANSVPDVRNMGVSDAVNLLEARGLRVRIHGQGRVSSQSIAPGTHAVKGNTITLELKK